MIKCILFDFDGVIVESADVKTEAFQLLFGCYPEHLKTITDYHITNGGISRYEKFRFIYKNILKKRLSNDKFCRLGRDFSKLVVEKVVSAPFVKGVEKFLENNMSRYSMFVVSGTPDSELEDIIRRRRLARYFQGIYGSSHSKKEIIQEIIEKFNFTKEEMVFIGDSESDLVAAKETGIFFIARNNSNRNRSRALDCPVYINNFKNIGAALRKIYE